jgi:hypothetical protein
MENSAPIDRISNLPDELLSHILSFLPTKLAFTTTVLSKRWIPLFKLLTTLHFDDESFSNKDAFPSIVERVVLSTELIKTFYLNCDAKHENRFNLWILEKLQQLGTFHNLIKTVKRHPVENLHIVSWYISFPLSIFIFPTLVVLKLNYSKVVSIGNISVDLPSLKTLHLIKVYFKNNGNFNKLLNGCPILQDLQTDHIYYLYREEGVRLKTLSKLMRANIDASDVPVKAIYNVQFLQLKVRYFDTKFHWINIMYVPF